MIFRRFLKGLAVAGNGGGAIPASFKNDSQITAQAGFGACDSDGRAQQLQAGLDASCIGMDESEKVKALDIGSVVVQQAEVNGLSFAQFTRLMQRLGVLKMLSFHLQTESANIRRNYTARLAGKIRAAGLRRP